MICKRCKKEYSESRSKTVCNACLFERNKQHSKHMAKKKALEKEKYRREESKIKRAHVEDCIFCGEYADITI